MFKLQVNPAEFSDWAALYDLLKESFAYMDKRIDPPSSFHRLDVDSLKLKAQQENTVIATDAERLIGCAFFKPLEDAVYIGKVAVDNYYRHRGLAKNMFLKIEQWAIAQEFRYLELETRVELVENHQTFAAMEFVKVGESAHLGYDRPTSITMRRKLCDD